MDNNKLFLLVFVLLIVGFVIFGNIDNLTGEAVKKVGKGNVNTCNKKCDLILQQKDTSANNLRRYKECINVCRGVVGEENNAVDQVVNAVDPKTGKCWVFKSSVDIPKGWQILKRIGRAPNCEWY